MRREPSRGGRVGNDQRIRMRHIQALRAVVILYWKDTVVKNSKIQKCKQ